MAAAARRDTATTIEAADRRGQGPTAEAVGHATPRRGARSLSRHRPLLPLARRSAGPCSLCSPTLAEPPRRGPAVPLGCRCRPSRPRLPAAAPAVAPPAVQAPVPRFARRAAAAPYCSRARRHGRPRAPALRPAAVPRPAGPAQPRPSRSRAGHVWPPCPVPLVGEGSEGASSPPRPATPPHGGTPQGRPPLRPAAPARCRISRGPRSAAGRARRWRREREDDKGGEERGDPDSGLVSSNREGLFQNGQGPKGSIPSISRSDGRPSRDPTAKKMAVTWIHDMDLFRPGFVVRRYD
ncbi:hypothetical protein C2845_PM17G06320 [Panicum miliaceum]|uniref:Uncharacterized protein n=1 Tax=Panicum miliaceum TaxID=4540 RepID=A0A3L6Q769_PANMI|nr:hypothetical protein C2845_PM17G06320 [Panicum miliaceum]